MRGGKAARETLNLLGERSRGTEKEREREGRRRKEEENGEGTKRRGDLDAGIHRRDAFTSLYNKLPPTVNCIVTLAVNTHTCSATQCTSYNAYGSSSVKVVCITRCLR